MNKLTLEQIDACAHAAHEANRAYCATLGDQSQLPWHNAPDWQKASLRKGVLGILEGNGPRENHDSWLREKLSTGWVYGETKDAVKRTHPCMVEYDQLPPEQRVKDRLFSQVVAAMASVFLELHGD